MVTYSELETFIDKDDCRELLNTLSVMDNNVIATDGYILISIPRDQVEYAAIKEIDNDTVRKICTFDRLFQSANVKDLSDKISQLEQKEEIVLGEEKKCKCPNCKGSGTVAWRYTDHDGKTHYMDEYCPICDRTGEAYIREKIKTGKMLPESGAAIEIDGNYFLGKFLYKVVQLLLAHKIKTFDFYVEEEQNQLKMRTASGWICVVMGCLNPLSDVISFK